MKNVVLAMPTYGVVLPEVNHSVISAIMFSSHNVIRWCGQASTDRESWSAARSLPVDAVRKYGSEDEIDGILWADSDMLFPKDAFARLVAHDLDLVSGVYFQRKFPYFPNVYHYLPKKRGFVHITEYPPDVVAPIGGFGFGICYTSMRLLREMPESPFKFGEFSEDLGFCRMAVERGFTPYVDTGVECEHHIGSTWSNKRKFERCRSTVLTRQVSLLNPDTEADYGRAIDGEEEGVRGIHQVEA